METVEHTHIKADKIIQKRWRPSDLEDIGKNRINQVIPLKVKLQATVK